MTKNDKKLTPSKQKLPMPLVILALLAILGLLVFAGVIGGQLYNKITQNKDASRQLGADIGSQPISILPNKPDGVTIVEKMPEPEETNTQTALAPISQGSEVASGFAMDLGPSVSFLELSRRFAELVLANGEENFQRLEPRAVLRETVTGLEARLLIGPFETEQQAVEACGILIVQPGTVCEPAIFQGDLIARE